MLQSVILILGMDRLILHQGFTLLQVLMLMDVILQQHLNLTINQPDGCTDATQFNYDANATCDDGSCIPFTYGCTDATADNYNSTVNSDDGSCIWFGCTDVLACNFDSTTNVDDCISSTYFYQM